MSEASANARKTNQDPVSAVYRAYKKELCVYIEQKFRVEPAEAEDIVHTAFTKLSSMGEINQIDNPRAFLYKSVANIAIDNRRHQRVQEAYQAITMPREYEAAEDHGPERIVDARQRLNILSRAMWHMPEKRRTLLLMNRYEHLSYAEIARRVGLSETVVRKHVAKALIDCHKALALRDKVTLSVSGPAEPILHMQGDVE
ncbi:MAG: RNA polymerase sigma factor (sigma-70 family) [Flavobacteriales bacterium]|jgi:RNA polymerase sigma factor (sigma-70 family)